MLPASADDIPLADRKSGYALMGREIQTMQDDDTANPGMLSVFDGETLWKQKGGRRGKVLRRLPRRRARQHARRCGTLSGLPCRARSPH